MVYYMPAITPFTQLTMHELFSADNGDGWWAMLSQSDFDKALGRRPTSAATTDDEVS